MLNKLNKHKLRNWLLLFFVMLLIPTAILIQQSYSRLKWETFHQYQSMAEELSGRIEKKFLQFVDSEEQRSFTDYAFLNVAGATTASFFQRSPLSKYPVDSSIPGVIGYFQVDAAGQLTTPLVPQVAAEAASYGILENELAARVALQDRIHLILSENSLLQGGEPVTQAVVLQDTTDDVLEGESDKVNDTDAFNMTGAGFQQESKELSARQGQRAFDELNKSTPAISFKQKTQLGRLEDLSLTSPYIKKEVVEKLAMEQQRKASPKKRLRTEQNVLPEAMSEISAVQANSVDRDMNLPQTADKPVNAIRISTFESEIDPFEFSRLGNEYFMLFRKVWRSEQRYIQGILINQTAFLENIINSEFRATALSSMSDLLVIHQGNVLQAFSARSARGYLSSARELSTELLYQSRLSAPFSDLQFVFSVKQLPPGAGDRVFIWLTFILLVVLCAGFYLLYRLGVGQINLFNQQQDFVSSVSHELKTPLTSIRMYGEMLREGWVTEEKKKTYYDFIFDESERLTRLINNVLLMARLTRNKQQVELTRQTVNDLMDAVKAKVSTQVLAADFQISMDCDENAGQASIMIDLDWFSQIMINLVDNAIKFSVKASKKMITIHCHQLSSGDIQFRVRDYGPGIPPQQIKNIFKLFYRTENELTRETVGTGIGLALVKQMVAVMNGRIDVFNSQPGAEFMVTFPQQL